MATKYDVGGLQVDRIVEMEKPYIEPTAFFPTTPQSVFDDNRSWLEEIGALDKATGNLVLCFQSHVVRTKHHVILVDACIGNHKDRPGRPLWHMKTDDTYMKQLAAVGLSVGDIDFVMCTHMHVDHVGWNTRLENGRWVPTFPKARYLFSKKEYDYWVAEHAKTPNPPIADSVIPIVEAKRADFITSDHAIDDTVALLPTPGHTPDHVSVWIPELRLLLAGDAAERPFPYVGDPDGLPALRGSLRTLAALAPETVIPCHGGPSDVGLLARDLAYFDDIERRAGAALASGALPSDWRQREDLPELLGLPYEEALRALAIAPESVPELWGYRHFHLLACRAALLDVAGRSSSD